MQARNIFPDATTQKIIMGTVDPAQNVLPGPDLGTKSQCLSHVVVGPVPLTDADIKQFTEYGNWGPESLNSATTLGLIKLFVGQKYKFKSLKVIVGLKIEPFLRYISTNKSGPGIPALIEKFAAHLLDYSLQNDIDGYEFWTNSVFHEVAFNHHFPAIVKALSAPDPNLPDILTNLLDALKNAAQNTTVLSRKHIEEHDNRWHLQVGIKIGPCFFLHRESGLYDALAKYDWIHLKCHGLFLQNTINSPLKTTVENAQDFSYTQAVDEILRIKPHGFLPKFIFEAPTYLSALIDTKIKITPYNTFVKSGVTAIPLPEIGAEYIIENGIKTYLDAEKITEAKAQFVKDKGGKGYSVSALDTDICYLQEMSISGAYYRSTEFMDTSFANIRPETYEAFESPGPGPEPEPEIALPEPEKAQKTISLEIPGQESAPITIDLMITIKAGPNTRTIKLSI